MIALGSKAFVESNSFHRLISRVQRCLLSSASTTGAIRRLYPKKEPLFVFTDKAPPGYDGSAVVYSEVISKEEESNILDDLKQIFRR